MEGMEEGVERDESHDLREYSWRQAHEIETRGFLPSVVSIWIT